MSRTITTRVGVDLPDFHIAAIYQADGRVFVDRTEVVSTIQNWALAVEQAHGDRDISMVLRTLATALAEARS